MHMYKVLKLYLSTDKHLKGLSHIHELRLRLASSYTCKLATSHRELAICRQLSYTTVSFSPTCRLPRSAYENFKLFKILRGRTVVTCYGRGVSHTDLVSHL